jgi:hypothetical protein
LAEPPWPRRDFEDIAFNLEEGAEYAPAAAVDAARYPVPQRS